VPSPLSSNIIDNETANALQAESIGTFIDIPPDSKRYYFGHVYCPAVSENVLDGINFVPSSKRTHVPISERRTNFFPPATGPCPYPPMRQQLSESDSRMNIWFASSVHSAERLPRIIGGD
jgi:hypothetical protein